MKIRVQHKNGEMETIALDNKTEIIEGRVLDRLKTESGMEHYFTKDGFYDGWASAIEAQSHADVILDEIERHREFDDSSANRTLVH